MSKRNRRQESEMFSVMGRYVESGLTQREFCSEADLPKSVFQYWWRRYRESHRGVGQSAEGGGFVELRSAGRVPEESGLGLELQLGNGAVLRFRGGLPPSDYVVGLLREFGRC